MTAGWGSPLALLGRGMARSRARTRGPGKAPGPPGPPGRLRPRWRLTICTAGSAA